jgi:FkbM family methyltransferase
MKKNTSWRGTFVEPVPYLFEKLRGNYGGEDRFTFVNAAVSDESKPCAFYYVSPKARQENPAFPTWVEQLGSFDKQIILENYNGQLAPYIVETEVVGISLPKLLHETKNESLDVLIIDTEGADLKILRQYPFERHAPTVILFEYCFFSEAERNAAKSWLGERYDIRDLGKDYFCRLKWRAFPMNSSKSIRAF